jgi:hypothetical protein
MEKGKWSDDDTSDPNTPALQYSITPSLLVSFDIHFDG